MKREKIKEKDPFDFEPGGSQFEAVFSKLGEKREELKRLREKGRASKDDITQQVSFRLLSEEP